MINKIFNWVGGSFFRTIGRFLFYALLLFILSLFLKNFDVKAADTYNSIFDTNIAASGRFYDFSSNVNAGTDAGYVFDISSLNGESYTFVTPINPNSHTLGTYGMSLAQCGMSFLKNNYYAVSYYFIGIGTYVHPYYTSLTYKLGLGTSYNDSNYLNFNADTISAGIEQFEIDDGEYLMVFTNIFRAYKNSTCVSMAYSSKNHNLSSYYAGFVGYKYTSLGSDELTTEEINNALQQNFTNIQNSINDMKTEQQETNDKLDKTNEELGEMNDYIQDDTPASTENVDLDSLGTVSGLLPAGPVDSLLNIPFTFLSVLTSSMSGTCVPITGTFVFDSTLSIPCFDSFYDDVPDYLMNFINLIPAGFILIMYFKHLYKKIERAVSLETTVDDEWGVI